MVGASPHSATHRCLDVLVRGRFLEEATAHGHLVGHTTRCLSNTMAWLDTAPVEAARGAVSIGARDRAQHDVPYRYGFRIWVGHSIRCLIDLGPWSDTARGVVTIGVPDLGWTHHAVPY
jgi:hypothetical protein